uniref:Uncharacterized protein n=1 Tax=Erpetoichthys calabaricus TaxID=27687 RepID=A0A8C4RFV2_ERPCA
MAETALSAPPAKASKKRAISKPKQSHCEPNGLSLNNASVNLSVKGLVRKGSLIQTKGSGASRSIKINKNQAEATTTKIKAAPWGKKKSDHEPAVARSLSRTDRLPACLLACFFSPLSLSLSLLLFLPLNRLALLYICGEDMAAAAHQPQEQSWMWAVSHLCT